MSAENRIIAFTCIPSLVLFMCLFNINTGANANNLVLPHSEISDSVSSRRDSVVHFSKELLGTPYVYGACKPGGFDCSGLVYYVFNNFGVKVPRSSSGYATYGKKVSLPDLKKGDVLVFKKSSGEGIGHVGIVVEPAGWETKFIHAASGKTKSVVVSSLSTKWYKERFIKAVNVL